MKRVCLLSAIIMFYLYLNAQDNIKISTPEVTILNNIMTIKYDLTGCGTGDYMNIRLIILNAKGDTIKPVYVTGDIGSRINCGFGKKIEWDIARDNILVNEEFEIQVTGKPVPQVVPSYEIAEKSVSRGNILLSSAFLPGLGQKKASGKGGYLALSGLVYGTAGASLFFYLKHNDYYNDYKTASGTERDNLYDKSVSSFNMSQYMLYSAAAIWAVNMIWSAVIPIKENSGKKMNLGLITLPESGYMFSAKWTF
jgi:hypothetical protein